MFRYLFMFIWVVGGLPSVAQAKVWFVATTGNDNHAGDLAHPFQSLPAAIEAANPGDEIQLRGGNYTSQEIRVNKSNLYIRSFPGEWAVITAITNVEDISACIWYNEPETMGGTLERLEIVGGYYYGIKFETNWDWDNSIPFAQRRGVSNITVRDCKIHHTGRDGIKLTPACANISILNCEIYYTGIGPGAMLDFNAEGIDNVNAPNLIVSGCHIHDIATTGVYVKGGGQNCRIVQNTIRNCGEGGVYLGFYTDAEWFDTDINPQYYENINGLVMNNLIVNTQHAGIGLWGAKDAKVYNNTVINGGMAEMACLFFNTADVWIDENNAARPGNVNVQLVNNIFVQGLNNTPMVRIRENSLVGNWHQIDYNCYYDTDGLPQFLDDNITWEELSFSQWKAQSTHDQHSFNTDPKLNEWERLLASSPCINMGLPLSTVSHDIDGHLRADGAIDIGADEYGAVSISNGPSFTDFHWTVNGNPFSDHLNFDIFSPRAATLPVSVIGMDGIVRWQSFIELLPGQNVISIPAARQWPAGVYALWVGGHSQLITKVKN